MKNMGGENNIEYNKNIRSFLGHFALCETAIMRKFVLRYFQIIAFIHSKLNNGNPS